MADELLDAGAQPAAPAREQPNPFAGYADPDDGDIHGSLSRGPAPSLAESFVENFTPLVGGLPAKLRTLADQRTVQKGDGGVAQPGDSPFAGKPSQAEVDAARQRYAKAEREREAYEAFQSPSRGKTAGLLGGLAGGLTDPTALIGAGGVVARGGVATAEALGITGALARTLGVGVEAGAVNAAMDAAGQGLDMASGLQKDGFSKTQTAGAFAIGAALGGGMHVVAEAIGRRIAAKKAAEDPSLRSGPADPVSISSPSSEAAKVDMPTAVVEGETASVTLPEQAVEAPALRPDPASDAAEQHAVRGIEAVPDKELAKIVEAVEMAQPIEGDRVEVPLSIEESALLKGRGVDVDETGTMPASVADAILQEKVRRESEGLPAAPEAPAARERSTADAQAMAASPRREGGTDIVASADRRFPGRREVAGEDTAARGLPVDATPEEVRAFRVTDVMRDIAGRLGRKLEVDGRFSLGDALGEYRPKVGVLRIRHEGDFQVFAHEAGHAIDHRLANEGRAGKAWDNLVAAHDGELRKLDANTQVEGEKTLDEGVAEFLRSYITNPAYARREAPAFTDAFERFVAQHDPELVGILADATRASQIDSGMAPTDVFRTMITFGNDMPRFLKGLKRFDAERRKLGLLPSLGLTYDRMYASVVSPDHWFKRFQDQLREARFQKTGQPLPEFGWVDPYKSYRGLPGAKQAAGDAIFSGVRDYGASFRDAPLSASLHDALSKAFDGNVTLIDKPEHPLTSGFSGYLIARRARALYDRWQAGDIKNPPVRASREETHAAIAQYEAEHPQFVAAADDIFDFTNAMWRKKYEAGLINREIYETVAGRNDDYVPFMRDMEDVKAGGGRGGGSAATTGRQSGKRLEGSTRQIIDPIHSIIFDAIKTERTIALNDTFKALHALAEQGGEFSGRFLERVPNSEIRAQSMDLVEGVRAATKKAGLDKADAETIIRHMEELIGDDLTATTFQAAQTDARGERMVFYWQDGQRVALKLSDDQYSRNFFDTVSAMSTAERDVVLAMVGKVNGLFSQLITNAPQFAIKNLLVDNITRMFIGRHTGATGRVPFASIAAGVHTIAFDRAFAQSYAALGGHRGGVVAAIARELTEANGLGGVAMKPKTFAEQAAHLGGLFEDAVHGRPAPLLFEVAKSPMHAIESVVKLIESTETLGRLGQAKLVFKHLKKQGLTDEEAFHGALYEARDILDYDRRGTGMNAAIKIATFLNPNIQGIERANRSLFGAPLQAAIESYRRDGYANIDEATKTALADAVKNWGMLALGTAATMGYYSWAKDHPVYQRATPYMRQHYYIFPLWDGADGTRVLTIPKPFDFAGALFSAAELAMDTIRRGDPSGWSKVAGALAEGFVPRVASSLNGLLSANPFVKVGFEYAAGVKIPFDEGNPMPIVPQSLAGKAPEAQYDGYTSWFAKKVGQHFGVSPMVADHVMNGIGGTLVKDANTMATAIFDDQPNVTVKDAMTRAFFGALYREQKGAGGFKSDLMKIMGPKTGEYVQVAEHYVQARQDGDREEAEGIYARADDLAKTIATLRSGAFKPELRQLHPLERTAALGKIYADITRDLASAQVQIKDRTRDKRGVERQTIDLTNPTARAIANTLGSLAAEEIRNGLTIAQVPGYQNFNVIDTKARYDAIKALSPEVAQEIEERAKSAHILPAETVQRTWPELKARLLQDREKAQIRGLGLAH